MRTSHLLTVLALGVALCSLPFVAQAAAPAETKSKAKATKKANDLTVLHALHNTNRLIEKADPIYKGHRGKAMHAINGAIGKLEKEAARHGLKVQPHKHAREAVAVSDAQIVKARDELTTILTVLAGLPKTKLRTQASNHVKTAIGELSLALSAARASRQ